MKNIKLLALIIGLIFLSCTQKKNSDNSTVQQTDSVKTTTNSNDKEEIKNLIRNVLIWSESKGSIDLLPVLTDSKDSVYIGFDLKKHKENLGKLIKTGFFSKEFTENYNQIILTLDKKLRNKEYDEWLVGELQTFIFANDVNPWWAGQDHLDWKFVEVEIINLNNQTGELNWTYGKLGAEYDSDWRKFKSYFKVVREDNKWKISYMEKFNFKESTRKDGEL
jgi:hypothetical protein